MSNKNPFSLVALKDDLYKAMRGAARNSTLINAALETAFEAHAGQVRERRDLTKEPIPYIVHPVGVAKLVVRFWDSAKLSDDFDTVVAATLTHDVVEDTWMDFSLLAKKTSERCAAIVLSLTKPRANTFLNRDERNVFFVKQIREAGAVSVYIKLCDMLHNLSRPSSMPDSLLDKTIKKASTVYLNLADGFEFKDFFYALIREKIESCVHYKMANSHIAECAKFDFDSFVSYLSSLSQSKILEDHDIVAILQQIPGVKLCFVVPSDAPSGTIFFENKHLINEDCLFEFNKMLTLKNYCKIDRRFILNNSTLDLPFTSLLSVPLFNSLTVKDTPYITLAVKDGDTPLWLNKTSLRFIVMLMAERLLVRHVDKLNELSSAIRHYGLDLDPSVALFHQLSLLDISKIKAMLDAADHFRKNILVNLDTLLHEHKIIDDIDRIESRTKSARSSLYKMKIRHIDDLNLLDDVIGIRLVSISLHSKRKIADIISGEIKDQNGLIANSLVVSPDSVSIDEISSSSGYSAIHIKFFIEPSGKKIRLGCEIQIRTLFEDAWARASHSLSYKKKISSSQKSKSILSNLAKLREDSDNCSKNFCFKFFGINFTLKCVL